MNNFSSIVLQENSNHSGSQGKTVLLRACADVICDVYRAGKTVILLILFGTTLGAPSWANKDESSGARTISSNIVVFANRPFGIGKSPIRFHFPSETSIQGKSNYLCVVIAPSAELSDLQERRKLHDEYLRGITLFGEVTKSDGSSVALSGAMYTWSRNGYVLENGEISSCIGPLGDHRLEIGEELYFLEISASKNVNILGAYWISTNRFDM